MSSWLLRRCVTPLAVARVRACAASNASLSVFSSPLSTQCALNCAPRTRFPAQLISPLMSTSSSPLLPRPLTSPVNRVLVNSSMSPVLAIQLKRFYSPGRNPWQNGSDWKSTVKTGGLVLLGTGALIASTSLAFGLVIAGAAGFGMYTLYQRFMGPYRSHFRSSSNPFSSVSSNVDALNDMFTRSRRRTKSAVQDDLDSLVQGMPLVVRGLVKTMFSFVGKAMQSSMERAGELRRRTNECLQANKRVREQMGEDVSVGGPEQWIESTVNGTGRVEAVFPVNGAYGSARVTMEASVGQGGKLNFTELKYRNSQTGDVIDLLRDSSVGGRRKTVIDAEYVDLDNDSRSRW
ncbi:Cytochrome oxidase complex assembly protein 1 [Phytophthora infestans]|uniref:Cytochrome oxidase complex assembly protein 1 n=1 Tax=Phytophthora infestans TaxID=4787 RepID=A0A833SZB2_PHYIN|nr:Cytochrome oxidase complex assembly protein 1 [Phytophthora infestans]